MVWSVLEYSLTAALIFISLYSLSTDFKPLPAPLFLGRYISDVDPSGCFAPFSTITLRVSLSNLCSSAVGQT